MVETLFARQASAPFVIGLVGRSRAGKDTAAARMVKEHGFHRVAFADELKRMAEKINPLVKDVDFKGHVRLSVSLGVMGGWERAKDRTDVRKFLQDLGQSVRDVDPSFWVNAAWPAVAKHLRAGEDVVITDVRYPIEVQVVRRPGWQTEQPRRGLTVGIERDANELHRPDSHISEQMNPREQDYFLLNWGDIEDLHRSVDNLINGLRKGPEKGSSGSEGAVA